METVHRYIRSMQARNLTYQTRRNATAILTTLSFVMADSDEPVDLLSAKRAHLTAWQELRATHITARTLRTNTSFVKVFYAWAQAEGLLDTNPAAHLRSPKVPRLLPRPMSEPSLTIALEAADARLKAVIGLGAYAGLRAMEIASLTWSDVDLSGPTPTARIMGKGQKEGLVDLSPDLVDILRQLPSRRGPVIPRGDGKGGHNTPATVSKTANRFLRKHGVQDTFHATRHRHVTWVVRIGGLRVGQEAARHADPSTTAGYAQVALRDIRAVIVRAGKLNPDTTYPAA